MYRLSVVFVVVCVLLSNVVAFTTPKKNTLDTSTWADAEVQETNLRVEAATPLNGFLAVGFNSDAACTASTMWVVMPLNRCIYDELEISGRPFMKLTMLPNMKTKMQGYKDSACRKMGAPVKFQALPPTSACIPSDDGDYYKVWYSSTRPSYGPMFNVRYYGNNKCDGQAYTARLFSPGCYPIDDGSSMYLSCAPGSYIAGYSGLGCQGTPTFTSPPIPINATNCDTKEGKYFEKVGCVGQPLGPP